MSTVEGSWPYAGRPRREASDEFARVVVELGRFAKLGPRQRAALGQHERRGHDAGRAEEGVGDRQDRRRAHAVDALLALPRRRCRRPGRLAGASPVVHRSAAVASLHGVVGRVEAARAAPAAEPEVCVLLSVLGIRRRLVARGRRPRVLVGSLQGGLVAVLVAVLLVARLVTVARLADLAAGLAALGVRLALRNGCQPRRIDLHVVMVDEGERGAVGRDAGRLRLLTRAMVHPAFRPNARSRRGAV